jgi:hypothetical protein
LSHGPVLPIFSVQSQRHETSLRHVCRADRDRGP